MPQTLTVLIEGEVGDSWRAGDDVAVSGRLDYRFKKQAVDQKMQISMVIFANSIEVQRSNNTRDIADNESKSEDNTQT